MRLRDEYQIGGDAGPEEPKTPEDLAPSDLFDEILETRDPDELRIPDAEPYYGINYSAPLFNDLPGEIEITGEKADVEDAADDALPPDVAFELALMTADEGDDVEALDDDLAADESVLGDEVTAASPGFEAYEATRIAASRPVLQAQPTRQVLREWDIGFGPVVAPAGRVVVVTKRPQVLYRGEKVMATDTGSTPGQGTRILQVAVGQRVQRPGSDRGTLTSMFAATALATGIQFDTAHPWEDIAITVSFVEECTFDMSLFGKAVV